MIELRFRRPISNNKRHGAGKYLSKEYRQWLTDFQQYLAIVKPEKVEGPFWAEMTCYRTNKRHGDLDNLWKCVLDGLERAGVIQNDKLMEKQIGSWENGDHNDVIIRVGSLL